MAQEYQSRHHAGQSSELDQNALVEKMAAALLQNTQNGLNAAAEIERDAEDEAATIDLLELFFRLLSKAHYIILAAIVGTLLAGLYGRYVAKPEYEATSTLYIVNSSGIQVSMADLQVASSLTQDYQRIFQVWELHELVIDALDLDYTYGQMSRMVSISNPSNTRMLDISVKNGDPELAAKIANEYANQAKMFIQSAMEGEEPNVVSKALVPTAPVSMSMSRYMILGFLAGSVLVMGIIVVLFVLDDRPHTPDDITKMAGIPTLAVVPREQSAAKNAGKRRKHRKERKA